MTRRTYSLVEREGPRPTLVGGALEADATPASRRRPGPPFAGVEHEALRKSASRGRLSIIEFLRHIYYQTPTKTQVFERYAATIATSKNGIHGWCVCRTRRTARRLTHSIPAPCPPGQSRRIWRCLAIYSTAARGGVRVRPQARKRIPQPGLAFAHGCDARFLVLLRSALPFRFLASSGRGARSRGRALAAPGRTMVRTICGSGVGATCVLGGRGGIGRTELRALGRLPPPTRRAWTRCTHVQVQAGRTRSGVGANRRCYENSNILSRWQTPSMLRKFQHRGGICPGQTRCSAGFWWYQVDVETPGCSSRCRARHRLRGVAPSFTSRRS